MVIGNDSDIDDTVIEIPIMIIFIFLKITVQYDIVRNGCMNGFVRIFVNTVR